MKPLVVKQIKITAGKDKGETGWGITDGKKWYRYAYAVKATADKIAASIGTDQGRRDVNVSIPPEYVMLGV